MGTERADARSDLPDGARGNVHDGQFTHGMYARSLHDIPEHAKREPGSARTEIEENVGPARAERRAVTTSEI
jgi:hypothetical protein